MIPLPVSPETKKVTPCTMADVLKNINITDEDHKKRGCKK
jgi:hypothetical protein